MSTSSDPTASNQAPQGGGDPYITAGLRKRVLTLTGAYLPGFRAGGPIRSLRNLHHHLKDQIQFDVVTANHDLGDTAAYTEIQSGHWNEVAGQRVFYYRPGVRGLLDILRVIRTTPHDVLYLNSFFSVKTTTLPLLARSLGLIPRQGVIVAPRGEFSAGALGQKSAKKRLFISLLRASPLFRDVLFQATNATEAGYICNTLGDVRLRVAPNLAVPPASSVRSTPETGPLRVVFMGRVSRMKNLDYALRVLARVKHPLQFTLAGPPEDLAYWAECQLLIQALPRHISVEVLGPVPPEQVGKVFLEQDVLLLPTLGENYGHVIVEALAHGCIPVISDRTPWQDLQQKRCGYSLSLDHPQDFVDALDDLASGDLSARSEAAREYGRQILLDAESLERNRRLFSSQ